MFISGATNLATLYTALRHFESDNLILILAVIWDYYIGHFTHFYILYPTADKMNSTLRYNLFEKLIKSQFYV